MEVVDSVSEMMDCKRKEFMEKAGIEDDVDFGIDINTY
jgi:hypothetical protein